MTLFRRFFYRKPPDGLLEISERVFVFDCCFTTEILDDDAYKVYIEGILGQLREYVPDASFMVFNFREGEHQSLLASILSEYDVTVIDYPRQYENCPVLTVEMIHHFLKSSESWLSLGLKNVLLMHCERGGWPVLAFMLAALLIFRKQYSGEQKTLDMIYKQAPRELLNLISPLDPLPSQLRYLQYISRRNVASVWPPLDRALTLDCIILRVIPDMDGEGGCRPVFRVYGQDPLMAADRTPKVLFSTPKKGKIVRHYKQADCELVKIDINCHVQGDVVLECITMDDNLEREKMMFRVMFNTAFIRSNILMLNRDEIDILWNIKDQFPKDFRAEVIFSEMNSTFLTSTLDLPGIDVKEGLPIEAFGKVQEIFSNVDWLYSKPDVARNIIHQITASNSFREKLDSVQSARKENLESSNSLKEAINGNLRGGSLQIAREEKSDCSSQQSDRKEQLDIVSPKSEKEGRVIQGLSADKVEKMSKSMASDSGTGSSTAQIESEELQAGLQRSAESKLVFQRSPIGSLSSQASYCNSLQGSPAPLSRYHSAPSVLGITALLHDPTMSETNGPHPMALCPRPAVSSSFPCLPTHATEWNFAVQESQPPPSKELLSKAVVMPQSSTKPFPSPPPPSPPQLPPRPPLQSGTTLHLSASEKLNAIHDPCSVVPPPPPSPPQLPPRPPSPSATTLLLSASEKLNAVHEQCSVVPSPPPSPPQLPPRPPSPSATTLHLSASEKLNAIHEPCSVVPPPPPYPPQLPTGLPSPSATTLHLSASEKLNAIHKPCSVVPPPPPSPPQLPPRPPSPSATTLYLSALEKLNATHEPCSVLQAQDRGKSGSVPPPPPLPFSHSETSLFPSIKKSIPASPPPPIPQPHETAASCLVKNSMLVPTPPPPPPPPPPSSSCSGTGSSLTVENKSFTLPPPPPPVPTTSAATTRVMSSLLPHKISAVAPPPPPPPLRSGLTASPTASSSVPAPPRPPNLALKESMPKISQHVPPVPPPPAPFSNCLLKVGGASLPPHSSGCNGKVPPPAPPFGAKGKLQSRSTPRNQSQSKKSNLKPYHWLKLTRAVQGSLWAEAQKPEEASKAPEFDMSELESLFAATVPNSDHGSTDGKSNRRASGPKSDKVNLIELRRAYNCEIMLTKVKIPLSDLMSSVLTLDDSALDVDQVDNLIKFCPTKEEMELLKNYNGDKENLGKCEQFFLELMKVPRVESKLRVFSFKMQFNSQVSDLRKNLNVINAACEEVRSSVKLKRIMQTILQLGNALNHGTARGSAVGFRLDSLLKLTDTRARNNKMTLMHYLCKVLSEKLQELLDFPEDLVNLEAATKIQLKYLAEEMQAISKGLEKVVQELTASENDGPVSETFCKSLKEFLGFAEAEVRSLASLYSGVGRNADALALYFGEDPARCPFEQVVSTLQNFVRMFIRAHNENCKQLEFEKKKALKEAENEKAKLNTSKKEQENEKTKTIAPNVSEHLIQSI